MGNGHPGLLLTRVRDLLSADALLELALLAAPGDMRAFASALRVLAEPDPISFIGLTAVMTAESLRIDAKGLMRVQLLTASWTEAHEGRENFLEVKPGQIISCLASATILQEI
jgi:hypothetical protein